MQLANLSVDGVRDGVSAVVGIFVVYSEDLLRDVERVLYQLLEYDFVLCFAELVGHFNVLVEHLLVVLRGLAIPVVTVEVFYVQIYAHQYPHVDGLLLDQEVLRLRVLRFLVAMQQSSPALDVRCSLAVLFLQQSLKKLNIELYFWIDSDLELHGERIQLSFSLLAK